MEESNSQCSYRVAVAANAMKNRMFRLCERIMLNSTCFNSDSQEILEITLKCYTEPTN